MNAQLMTGAAMVVALGLAGCQSGNSAGAATVEVLPGEMAKVGTVDPRFQSYNVEMLEVTGGAFWKPYGASKDAAPAASDVPTPAGMDPSIYQYRPPMDLTNPRLRTLAAALGPAYVRVSGTWANTTYFPDNATASTKPPEGFNGVLTHDQWKGLIDFTKAVDGEILTSFTISPGVRDASGVWTPDQAQRWVEETRKMGGEIAAAEFFNEPSLAAMGGAPENYTPADYGRDFKVFKAFADRVAPDMIILGPGSVGETPGPWSMDYGTMPLISTEEMLTASGPGVDGFSYHHYGAASQRCVAAGMPQIAEKDALSEDWLGRTSKTLAYYAGLRDKHEPGKPMWLTEVAETACGGNPWAATFTDTFRYLDQLGRLAKEGVKVVAHNTLVASDYGLLDENTLEPRPSYWGALLWSRLMGTTVLDSGVPIQEGLHVYAQCQRDTAGGVTMLVINNDQKAGRSLTLPQASERYTLDAAKLTDKVVRLNGQPLALGPDNALPTMTGVATAAGKVDFAPATITFVTIPTAGNSACSV